MKIKKISLDNFRCFDRLEIQLAGKVNLLIGNNGSGKSALLDALSIGLGTIATYLPEIKGISFKKSDLRKINDVKRPFSRIRLSTFDELEWDVTQKRDNSANTRNQIPRQIGISKLRSYLDADIIDKYNASEDFDLPVFACYGVSRAVLKPLKTRDVRRQSLRFHALANAFVAQSRFHSGFSWFYKKENEEHRLQKERKSFSATLKELDAVRFAVTTMFPDLADPHIQMNPVRFVVKKDGESLGLDQLSDGYKTMLGLVVDLGSRLAMANPHQKNPLDSDAIVMIDEIDLHLHPSWQQRVIGDLIKVFPNTQFIFTTHSPYILEALNNHLKKDKIRGLGTRDSEIEEIAPLHQEMVKAFVLEDARVMSILNEDSGLIDNRLINIFNSINTIYDRMRDLEWEHKND